MKERKIEMHYKCLEWSELDPDEQRLVEQAMKATDRSYSPYSMFCVGAALRLENGEEFLGANQENAAFPVTLCAERTAIFAAQVQYPDQPIVAIAIAARNVNGFTDEPVTPCGSCRQVMLEIEQRYHHPIKIYLYGVSGIYVIETVKDLMPLCFVDDSMR